MVEGKKEYKKSEKDRVTPAFRFCLSNSTLTQAIPIRYSAVKEAIARK